MATLFICSAGKPVFSGKKRLSPEVIAGEDFLYNIGRDKAGQKRRSATEKCRDKVYAKSDIPDRDKRDDIGKKGIKRIPRRVRNAEQPGGLGLVAPRQGQRLPDQITLHVFQVDAFGRKFKLR